MSTLVSRANVIMSLATPPSTDAEDGDTSSSSSSPHIDTSRILHEKISANDGGHEYTIDSSEYQVQDNVFIATSDQSNCVDIPDFNAVGLELEACCGAGDVALDVIPARMYEACELEEHNRDGNDAYKCVRNDAIRPRTRQPIPDAIPLGNSAGHFEWPVLFRFRSKHPPRRGVVRDLRPDLKGVVVVIGREFRPE